MSTYLITGVAGFIGSSLARSLLGNGHIVHGLDNFETGAQARIRLLRDYEDFEFFNGDLRSLNDV